MRRRWTPSGRARRRRAHRFRLASCAAVSMTDGTYLAIENLIEFQNGEPNIISVSYGWCETSMGEASEYRVSEHVSDGRRRRHFGFRRNRRLWSKRLCFVEVGACPVRNWRERVGDDDLQCRGRRHPLFPTCSMVLPLPTGIAAIRRPGGARSPTYQRYLGTILARAP